jgi:hypothetical protein
MKKLIRLAVLLSCIMLSFVMVTAAFAEEAGHIEKYEALVKSTIQAIITGSTGDIDKLMADQEVLMEIALEECEEHKEDTPADAKIMDLVINNASRMKTSSLDQLEEDWHDGGILTANGIDFDGMDPVGPTSFLMHMVVHPASAYVAMKEYKSTKDKDLLESAKDELSELLNHLDNLKEHLEEHGH